MSLRAANKMRPENMTELDFPHKIRPVLRKKPLTQEDKFNRMVGELRILLNKLSRSNFDTIKE